MQTPLYTAAAGFDKAAIMADAWKMYREEVAHVNAVYHPSDRAKALKGEFARALRIAWHTAKQQRTDAEKAAAQAALIAVIPMAERVARAEALRQEATCIEMLDRDGSTIHRARRMQREADALLAA